FMNIGRNIILLLFILIPGITCGQVLYHFNQDISVIEGEQLLSMPWVGGLNTPQYNELDIDQDGNKDLVIFNRDNNKLFTFIREGSEYKYMPEYEHFFPDGLEQWVLLRDYNCDGKEDIFTSSIFGMSLYGNITEDGGNPEWELVYETIFTEGIGGQLINLQINSMDLPGIQDVDGDGDLDVFSFNFAVGGGVHFHKNMSVERTGICNLDLVRVSEEYGDFMECSCEVYVFGAEDCLSGGRLQHSGGKSVNSFDYSGNGIQDMVIGQETCTYIGFLENAGTVENPLMPAVDFIFPNTANPITLDYPAVYNIDINLDGEEDLIATNNMFLPDGLSDYTANNWYYEKSGSEYNLVTRSYMQDMMMDVGFAAAPALADIDGDGDEDLIVGSGNQGEGAKLFLYENDGDALNPRLVLKSSDYLQQSTLDLFRIVPQFLDIDRNGRDDLILYRVSAGQQTIQVYWNTANPIEPFNESNSESLGLPVLAVNDNPHLYFSNDKFRLLVGREAGGLLYYVNQATAANPQWELISSEFLGIVDDFRARNVNVMVDDLNNDSKDDLIRYDDSGKLKVYMDFINEVSLVENIIQDKVSFLGYNSSFGTNAKLSTTKITGSQLPSIMAGLWAGGIELLSNIEDTQQDISVNVRVAVFPNPVKHSHRLNLLPNQDVEITIVDVWGHVVTEKITLPKNELRELEIASLSAGLYIILARNAEGKKGTYKFIISE
ncbi:MAG: T9SS type A sorting domain-containing protein, partial [Bacteroidota bacterium]